MSVLYEFLIKYAHFAKENRSKHLLVWMVWFLFLFFAVKKLLVDDELVYFFYIIPLGFLFWLLKLVSDYKASLPD